MEKGLQLVTFGNISTVQWCS